MFHTLAKLRLVMSVEDENALNVVNAMVVATSGAELVAEMVKSIVMSMEKPEV
jgi:hypothetical protein